MAGYTLRPNQKLRTLQRGSLIVAGASILGIVCYFTLFFSQVDTTQSFGATKNKWMDTDPINNGEIVCMFTWNENPVITASMGSSGTEASINSECIPGGKDQTFGLSAGTTSKPINLLINADETFNMPGIDISLDYNCMDENGSFFARGNYFNFGIKDKFLVIKYKTINENGKTQIVDETTRYEVQQDNVFRNYRFLFNPDKGRGEIFVDNIAVWVNENEEDNSLTWKKNDVITIAKNMNGNASAKVIMDNFIIRNTGQQPSTPFQLLSFTAEIQGSNVMINWFTGNEKNTDYFKVERSSDTYVYEEIGTVKAAKESKQLKAYALLDTRPVQGVCYYRLIMNNNASLKSVWIPVIALRNAPSTKYSTTELQSIIPLPTK